MQRTGSRMWWGFCLIAVIAGLLWSQGGTAQTRSSGTRLGGPRGVVRSSKGFPIEGMMVQLISQKTAIRTTVFANEQGQYEFPRLEAGLYALRTPRPQEFRRYLKEQVQIDGATKLDDIVLEPVSDNEFAPPTPDILSQLTDSEWLYNMPGTAQEKKIFSNYCGGSCHSYQMPMRSRFDERSWRLMVTKMTTYGGRLLLVSEETQAARRGETLPPPDPRDAENKEILVKWLTKVRGPEASYPPMKFFPRAQGPATRAILTEYEIPSVGVHVHDVAGDAAGNIWYTLNRSPIIGRLDPKTGKVTEWKTPGTDGKHPGGHWIRAAKDGTVWYSET